MVRRLGVLRGRTRRRVVVPGGARSYLRGALRYDRAPRVRPQRTLRHRTTGTRPPTTPSHTKGPITVGQAAQFPRKVSLDTDTRPTPRRLASPAPACASSSARSVWTRAPRPAAGRTAPCTASSQPATRSSPPPPSRRSRTPNSATWGCLTLRTFRITHFGPLIVSIDTHGNNLFEWQKIVYNERKKAALAKLESKVRYIG